MAYAASDRAASPGRTPVTIEILIAGGFGVGKTTLVGSLTEIRPLRTEEPLSEPGAAVDRLDGVERKRTTTVALDFGRITIRENLVIYLFGTPGQDRFWFMWDELARGALGAIVMADTRRLADCFPSADHFERRGAPIGVGVNCVAGTPAPPWSSPPSGAASPRWPIRPRPGPRPAPRRQNQPPNGLIAAGPPGPRDHVRQMRTSAQSSEPPPPALTTRTSWVAALRKPAATRRVASPSRRSVPASMSRPGASTRPSVYSIRASPDRREPCTGVARGSGTTPSTMPRAWVTFQVPLPASNCAGGGCPAEASRYSPVARSRDRCTAVTKPSTDGPRRR